MRSFAELTKNPEQLVENDEEYRSNFNTYIKTQNEEDLKKMLLGDTHRQEEPAGGLHRYFCVAPVLAAVWARQERYQDVYDLLHGADMTGQDRRLDFYSGKIIKYYAQALKHLGMAPDPLYGILVTNKEYGNRYTVAVTTNAILDRQVNAQIYEFVEEEIAEPRERCQYLLYHGVIHLVRGEYEKALYNFDECTMLKGKKVELLLKKYTIVCKMLMGDYTIFYPYQRELRPYFAMIGCMKRGDAELFYRLLEEFRDEYFGANLYFVMRRLLQNLVREGLRRVSLCYSRIRVSDISRILGVNIEYFMHRAIDRGVVEDGVLYAVESRAAAVNSGEQVRRAIEVRMGAKRMIKYPEIVPLSYEKVTGQQQ